MAKFLNVIEQHFETALTRLPERTRHLLRHSLTQRTLAILVGLWILRSLNRSLSHWAHNNWRRTEPWVSSRELVLLTGGCSGIGKQVMKDLARTGVRVIILDIVEPTFQLPANVVFYRVDVTSSKSIAEAARAIRSNYGDPTVLVNNAGLGSDGTILDEPEEKIRQTFEVNTMSHFWMVKEFLPAMIRANHGHVVTIASMASFVAPGELADYCGSKASVLAFHESLRQELRYWYNAPKVRTSIIHPLWVRTPMIKILTDHESHFSQPIMTVQTVADAICKQILSQNSGQVILPSHMAGLSLVRALPIWMQEAVRSIASGGLRNMRHVQQSELK